MIKISKTDLAEYYKQEISEFETSKNTGHVLLLSNDEDLLIQIIEYLTSMCLNDTAENRFKNIENIVSIKNNLKEDTIYLLDLDDNVDKELMKLLYFYLETKVSIFFIMFSCRVNCVDEMEKRVRSRFNGNSIFFPQLNQNFFYSVIQDRLENAIADGNSSLKSYIIEKKENVIQDLMLIQKQDKKITKKTKKKKPITFIENVQKTKKSKAKEMERTNEIKLDTSKIYKTYDTTLKNIEINIFNLKNNIEHYKNNFGYELLTPIHFTILIISVKNNVEFKNIVSKFRKFTSGISEIGNIDQNQILNSFVDCKKLGYIEKKYFVGDINGFYDYIKAECPFYIKNMINITRKV